MRHTPGPWVITPKGQLLTALGGQVANLRWVTLADFQLIAAAPDLLEACKSVFAGLQAKADSRRKWRVSDQEDYDTLHIAIAKAEGN